MTKILITGGLGFLGQHLAKALLNKNRDFEILILARSKNRIFLNELHTSRVNLVYGADISRIESMGDHFRNIDYVFHTAAMISFWYKDKKRMNAVNVVGTKNVVDLCLKYKVKRLVYVGSTAAIKGSNDVNRPANESNDYDWRGKSKYHYGLSKLYAKKEVEKGISKGLDAVIATPCSILGYGDTKIFPLIETALKKVPFCFSGGSHMVDVRDLVDGMILSLEKGGIGERYLLIGNYHTQLEILTSLARILKTKPPAFVISSKVVALALPFLAVTDFFSKAKPKLTATMATNSLSPSYFTNMRSKQSFGWTPQYSLDESLTEAVKYYMEVRE